MALKEATFFTLTCDWPGCNTTLSEQCDTWQFDIEATRETADSYEWHHEDGQDYCDGHYIGSCDECFDEKLSVRDRDNGRELCDECDAHIAASSPSAEGDAP